MVERGGKERVSFAEKFAELLTGVMAYRTLI